MKKPPLTIGTRIKFVGWARVTGFEECNYFAEFPTQAVVDLLVRNSPDSIRIKYGNDIQGLIHRRQVVSVLRPKAAKPKEERRILSINEDEYRTLFSPGHPCYRTLTAFRDERRDHRKFFEVRPGEVLVSREDLARAWASVGFIGETRPQFSALASSLGFPEEKK